MTDPIEQAVLDASTLVLVRRRVAGVRGVDGRLTPGSELTARVMLTVQPARRSLTRVLAGDSSDGEVKVFASLTNLAAAYLDGDVGETPLAWTSLQIAPAKGSDGPPGDRVDWHGREHEITGEQIWDAPGLIPEANLRTYDAADRGASP